MAGFFVIASRQTAIYRPPLHCAAVSLGRPVDIDMKALRFIALLLAVGAAAYVYLRPADQRALTELRDLSRLQRPIAAMTFVFRQQN